MTSYDQWKTTDPREYLGKKHHLWRDLDVWEDREIIEYLERIDEDDFDDMNIYDLAKRCGDRS